MFDEQNRVSTLHHQPTLNTSVGKLDSEAAIE